MSFIQMPQKTDKIPALFLDRDGVINVDKGYVDTPDGFEFIPGAIETIQLAKSNGWLVFIVTNQTGIAHGFYTEADMFRVHAYMQSELLKAGTQIDRIYYCPYDIRGAIPRFVMDSDLRKPNPGMILKAMDEFPIEKDKSILIGDKLTDIKAAQAAGIKGFLFREDNLFHFFQKIVVQESLDIST